MLPEISRRCLSCGAAARAGARFCPQCGKSLVEEGAARKAGDDKDAGKGLDEHGGPKTEAPTRDAEAPAGWSRPAQTATDWSKPTREFSAFVQSLGDDEARAGGAGRESPTPVAQDASPSVAQDASSSVMQDATGAADSSTNAKSADAGSTTTPMIPTPAPVNSTSAPVNSTAASVSSTGATAPSVVEPGAGEAFEERRGRVARVREGTRARVVKARDEARVVLEETPDDSGLRFVVVAVVVFALFLFLLFMSTTVLR